MYLVSIIIPTFNRKKFIEAAVNSVVNQLYKNIEVIIVDDGSEDGSYEYLTNKFAFDDRVKVLKQSNQGVSSARNHGIKHAKGEWLAFLDSDDFFHNDKLLKQIKYLEENPGYKICHTEEIWLKDGIRINPHKKHQKLGGNIFDNSVKICSISISTVMVHKSIFTEIGLFDETMPACEDYDYWLRVTAKYPVLFLNEFLTTKHGGHEDQLSKKYWGMDRFRIFALKKIIQNGELTTEQLQDAASMLASKTRILYKGAKKHNNLDLITLLETEYSEYLTDI